MRRTVVAVVGLVAGVATVVAVARSFGRPRRATVAPQPIPPTLPPGIARSDVPAATRPVPDLQSAEIGRFLRPARRSETIAVAVLVVLSVAIAAGLFVLLEARSG